MTILSLKNPWTNGDGLKVYFPRDAGTVTRGGERDYDGRHETFVKIDLTTIAAYNSSNWTLVAENVIIPKSAFIEDVEVVVLKETAGSSATLDLGLVKLSDGTTEIDFNGLLAAASELNAGTDLGRYNKYNLGTSHAGALIGSQITTDAGLIVAACNTANFSAGIIEVRIHWFVPNSVDL